MKKCQTCQFENEDAMSFCLECGTPLAKIPQMVVNLQDSPTASLPSAPTVFSGNRETETFVANQSNFASNFQTSSTPKSKNKTFLIVGGVGALLFLGLMTIAGVVIYNLIPSVSPKPTPTPFSTATPLVDGKTPNVSPTATPQASFTPPIEPTKKASFTVYANSGWQLSEIDTVPLEEFRTTVQGKIDVVGVKTGVSSSGVNDAKTKSRRIYPEFPTGALLMRTRYAGGKYSNVASLTTNGSSGNWQNFPDERGRIEFCINDNAPENNGGQFTVNVTLTRVPKAKK